MNKLARKVAYEDFIKQIGNNPSTVSFNKRIDGTKRVMHLINDWNRLENNTDAFGYTIPQNPTKVDYAGSNLALVWDLDKQAFRMVNLNSINRISQYKKELPDE